KWRVLALVEAAGAVEMAEELVGAVDQVNQHGQNLRLLVEIDYFKVTLELINFHVYRWDMKVYGQFCGIAKALDVIGDRWSLLVVRELLVRGPCRYTDLRAGLPGIATNLLADRLVDLEIAGVIRRAATSRPTPAALF